MESERFTMKGVLAQGGSATMVGYMMYAAWDSMERDRYLAAYQGAGEIPILWSPVFLTVALLCALAAFLARKDVVRTVRREPFCWAVPLAASASSITLCLQRLAGETPNPVLIATFAVCIAWYVLAWAERFGSLGGVRTLAVLLVADALSALFQIVCVQTMGSMALLVTTALMPLASFALLRATPRESDEELRRLSPTATWSWGLVAGIGAFGMLYFMLRSMLYIHPYSYVDSIVVPVSSLLTLAVLAALAFGLRASGRFIERFIPCMLGVAVLLSAVAIVLTSFFQVSEVWSMLVVMSNRCGFIALVIALAEACKRQRVHPIALFGVGFAALYAGYSIGGFIGVNLARYDSNATGLLLGCSLLALFCVGLGLVWMFRTQRAEQPAGTGDVPAEASEAAAPSLDECYERAIQGLASAYALSPREGEVLMLVARGRSSTYISEALFISPNTTKKHIQHVYKKLGVHSNQEAIDLVEEECRALA
ncbi:response regulator transcription factor [Arabiibacter massiliensis]|uniref:response regulator transcription factor n=1 Tax=Arabiibacter massiliensis TaxID=1870985 RepID=UPI000B424D9A|nr:helix-turn-helix transcriptional regulator [Arabiibacter massiliensis]